MNNFNKNIDKLVSRILNEEIEGKVKELSKKINEGEWTEVEIDEEVNEVRKRRIKGLMQKDQCIDLFMEAEIDVGKTKKRLYENIPHK